MNSREAFEASMRERFGPVVNLTRSQDGYIGTVSSCHTQLSYASVQMLWESWQAATAHARDVAVQSCQSTKYAAPRGDHNHGYNDGCSDCDDAIKEALK